MHLVFSKAINQNKEMTFLTSLLLTAILLFPSGAEATSAPDTADVRPNTVHEAVFYLRDNLPERDIERIKDTEEMSFVGNALTGDGMGRWIIEEWKLWSPGRLNTFFNRNGISQPLEMAEVILTSLHRHLNGRPMHINQQMEEIRAYWEEQEEGLKKKREGKEENNGSEG